VARVIRPQVGPTEFYRGRALIDRACQPDVICEVDGEDLPAFYLDAESARAGGRRYVDQIEKEKAERDSKGTRKP
jgi:hypothetical protein